MYCCAFPINIWMYSNLAVNLCGFMWKYFHSISVLCHIPMLYISPHTLLYLCPPKLFYFVPIKTQNDVVSTVVHILPITMFYHFLVIDLFNHPFNSLYNHGESFTKTAQCSYNSTAGFPLHRQKQGNGEKYFQTGIAQGIL